MHVCYFDESGDTRPLPAGVIDETLPRVFVFAGVSYNARENSVINTRFVEAKAQFLDQKSVRHQHNIEMAVPPEVKGQELRRAIGSSHSERAVGFLNEYFELFKAHDIRIHGRVFIKEPGADSKGEKHYDRAVQLACTRFHERLDAIDHQGVVIIDNRNPSANERVAHAIYVNKYRTKSDYYPRIVDLPTFGQSQNHAGLQLADIACELLASIALVRYFDIDGARKELSDRYAERVAELQTDYVSRPEKTLDGVAITTLNGEVRSPHEFFFAEKS